MNYECYIKAVMLGYGCQLVGWPKSINFTSPTNTSSVDNMRTIRDALKEGTCRWKSINAEKKKAWRAEYERAGGGWQDCGEGSPPSIRHWDSPGPNKATKSKRAAGGRGRARQCQKMRTARKTGDEWENEDDKENEDNDDVENEEDDADDREDVGRSKMSKSKLGSKLRGEKEKATKAREKKGKGGEGKGERRRKERRRGRRKRRRGRRRRGNQKRRRPSLGEEGRGIGWRIMRAVPSTSLKVEGWGGGRDEERCREEEEDDDKEPVAKKTNRPKPCPMYRNTPPRSPPSPKQLEPPTRAALKFRRLVEHREKALAATEALKEKEMAAKAVGSSSQLGSSGGASTSSTAPAGHLTSDLNKVKGRKGGPLGLRLTD
ncbi:hypothetical protein B0H14DRAFT_2636077 [Mycena olivaceomarginata]|nr:hypothetical protein B0H14DRAFT_2636077 [Mycena olivaceomarginata]